MLMITKPNLDMTLAVAEALSPNKLTPRYRFWIWFWIWFWICVEALMCVRVCVVCVRVCV